MSLGIQSVASYIPEERLELAARAREWGLPAEFLRKTGFTKVARARAGENAVDLATRAVEKLRAANGFDPAEIELIVLVTQNPGRPVPHGAALLHARLGAPARCLAFDLSHGCSGYVYGLVLALSLMRDQGLRRGILCTADPYSGILDPADKDTMLLFGDAATATLLSDRPFWECGRACFHTDGAQAESLAFRDGYLRMDGAQVFGYAATQVPREIAEALRINGLRAEEIDAFLLHSGSRYIVDTIAQRAALPIGKVPFPSEEIGNTVSSSLPILLERLHAGTNVLLAGFGVGLSCATTILRRQA
jgi:3-oxoacyl-[acyl-carrier-protein] synthase-3